MFGWILRAWIYGDLWYLEVTKIIVKKGRLPLNVIQRQSGPKCEEKQAIYRQWRPCFSPVLCFPFSGTPWDYTLFFLLFTVSCVQTEGVDTMDSTWTSGTSLSHGSQSACFCCCHLMISFPTENKSMEI